MQSAVHKRGTHNAVHTMGSAEHSAQVGQGSQLLSKRGKLDTEDKYSPFSHGGRLFTVALQIVTE